MCREDGPLYSAVCYYKSQRLLRVRNRKLVLFYFLMLCIVLAYIVVYTVYYNKGYQKFTYVVGTTTPKVKGTAGYKNTLTNETICFDSLDLVQPRLEEDSLFIATSMVITANQTRGYCSNNLLPKCDNNNDCTKYQRQYNTDSLGIYNGICENSYCQVYSWCPLENKKQEIHFINVGNFTV